PKASGANVPDNEAGGRADAGLRPTFRRATQLYFGLRDRWAATFGIAPRRGKRSSGVREHDSALRILRISSLVRRRRLPGDQTAMGNFERDRPEHGRDQVEGCVGRISET